MKLTFIGIALALAIVNASCASKQLVKNCSPVGKMEDGRVLSECEKL